MSSLRKSFNRRGGTILEGMIAMAVLAIGLLGLFAAQVTSANQNASALRKTRAIGVAQDVAAVVRRAPYTAIAESVSSNNPGGTAAVLKSGVWSGPPNSADYEYDLNTTPMTGMITNLNFYGDSNADYLRYLAVYPVQDANGNALGRMVRVVVAWRDLGRWNALVLPVMKYDPASNQATIPGL